MKSQGKYVLASLLSGAILGIAEYVIHREVSSALIIAGATFITAWVGMNWRRL